MDPRDFVQLASTLVVKRQPSAALCRTAIGRAYHGAFHCADQLLRSLGATVGEGPQAQGMVPRLLQSSGDADLEATGGVLRDLHSLRRRADYQLNPSLSVETRLNAMKAVLDADRIVRVIETFSKDDARREAAISRVLDRLRALTGKIPPPVP